MRLKKLLVVPFVFLAVVLGLNLASFSSEYYCGPKDPNVYNSSYLYDTASTVSSCDTWNDDFWKKNGPDLYGKCVKSYNQNKAVYAAGGCIPITVKNYTFDASKCTVKFIGNTNRYVYKSCSGPNANKLLEQWK